jgi:branched-chain amino acid transport system permease protein
VIWANDVVQGVALGGLYALLGYGLAIVFGVMKVTNVAHGDLAVVAAYLAAGLVAVGHLSTPEAIVLTVPVFAVLGYVGQRTVLQASLNRGAPTALLVTFGLAIVIESGLQQFFTTNPHNLEIGALSNHLSIGSKITVSYLDVAFLIVSVVVLIALQVLLSATPLGQQFKAVTGGRRAAELSAAGHGHLFGIAGAVAMVAVAIAGTSYGLYSSVDPTTGMTQLLLLAFEAVVIGGLGSLWGTLAGGILLGVVQQIGTQISPGDQLLAPQLFFLAMLLIRPDGVTGRRQVA